jgi:hypothetical protein
LSLSPTDRCGDFVSSRRELGLSYSTSDTRFAGYALRNAIFCSGTTWLDFNMSFQRCRDSNFLRVCQFFIAIETAESSLFVA